MSDLSSGPARFTGAGGVDRAHSRIAGRYDLGEVIGVGAPAWVYRAEDRETGRVVAVKLYPKGYGGPDHASRQRELGVLSGLHHPNLVELLDAGDESGRAYLVMELVEGRTLAQRVLDGSMAAGEVARLGADLGYALAYLHSRGIVHRSVKPSNVLLGMRPMLTDFGTAVLVDPASVSLTGSLIGSPAYLAPEQVNGAEVGMPADVYALGLMLIEALTGRKEFAGDGLEAAMARLSRRPSVPEDLPVLTDVLYAMTMIDPAGRPTAGVVSEQLRAAAPELDGAPSVRLAPDTHDPRDLRPSTLERLENLDMLETSAPPRSPGSTYTAAAIDDSRGVEIPPARDDTGRKKPASALDDSGTKLLPMAPTPPGLPLPPEIRTPPDRREASHRRLLAGVLGLTGLAAATVGVLVSQGPADMDTVPDDSAPAVQSPLVPPVRPSSPTPALTAPDADDVPPGADGGDPGSAGGSQNSKKHKGSKKGKKH